MDKAGAVSGFAGERLGFPLASDLLDAHHVETRDEARKILNLRLVDFRGRSLVAQASFGRSSRINQEEAIERADFERR